MAVLQTALDIPDDVFAGLVTGEYVRDGGVVRDLAGRLVKLLDDASPVTEAQESARAALAKSLTRPRSVVIGLAVAAVAAAAGGVALVAVRRRRPTETAPPACVATYNASLAACLEAARAGTLDAGIINQLIADLDALLKQTSGGSVSVDISLAETQTLVGIIAEHTRSLAEANDIDLDDLAEVGAGLDGRTIVDLRRYLELQGKIFGEAA
jgi:hypothetical protein